MTSSQNLMMLCTLATFLTACQSLPENMQTENLRLIIYRNQAGQLLPPIARTVSSKRQQAWQQWLTQNHSNWNTSLNQIANGNTIWCAQWQHNNNEHRICNRNNQTLVWFGYGQTQYLEAIQTANKIWDNISP